MGTGSRTVTGRGGSPMKIQNAGSGSSRTAVESGGHPGGGRMNDEKFSEEVLKLLTEHSERTGMTLDESYDYLLGRLKQALDEEEV